MGGDDLQLFIHEAGAILASVRGCLLIVSQTGDVSHLAAMPATFARIRAGAKAHELAELASLTKRYEAEIADLATTFSTDRANSALDVVVQMEALLWSMPVTSNGFEFDPGGFVDASFADLLGSASSEDSGRLIEELDVDEETLEVFRAEADELLSNIRVGLRALVLSPDDHTALWDIRRNAHTFKGAAGIVGLHDACRIAHRMEDLLDKLVETRCAAAPAVIEFLENAARSLASVVTAEAAENRGCLKAGYEKALMMLSGTETDLTGNGLSPWANETVRAAFVESDPAGAVGTRPIVRVFLDRLDGISKLAERLTANRTNIGQRFAEIDPETVAGSEPLTAMRQLLAQAMSLADEIEEKLRGIRMVRFSTLDTRLNRAVNVTCLDENKKADVKIENGDTEIDTQMMDALIEPLLHLLKNAVVHGIEAPDTRRLIGKPERGKIAIRLSKNGDSLVLSVSDDGGGIGVTRLVAEATSKGVIDNEGAARLSEADAFELIFYRGLTTAAKLDMNAGRGVGMSIVKESIESLGGLIRVHSQPQQGTTFTLHLPLANPPTRQELAGTAGDGREFASLVLIVDDSTTIRHQMSQLVNDAGFRVVAAENGAEALELLLSGKFEPDLIISDVEMPQIDGWDLLNYLKTDENLGHIPVIMVTSLNSDDHRQRAFDLGAVDYIVKPFSVHHLERVLARSENITTR